jgi:carbon-monoxide dehydrogenase large subunit
MSATRWPSSSPRPASRRATAPSGSASTYSELPAVISMPDAIKPGAQQVHDQAPQLLLRLGVRRQGGRRGGLQGRPPRRRLDLVNNRLVPNAMEPRAAIGDLRPRHRRVHALHHQPEPARHPPADGRLRAEHPGAQAARGRAGRRRRLRLEDLHYAEEAIVTWAASKLGQAREVDGRPLGSFMSDAHGRDHVTTVELALDKDGKFLALRENTLANMGAYLSTFRPACRPISTRPCWPGLHHARRSMPR